MGSRKVIGLVSAASFLAMWGVAAFSYGALPERFPSHFDASGVPDAFMTKSMLGWFALPMIFSLLAALFVGLAVLVPSLSAKHPTIINVPSKARFLALPESARAQALEPMRDLMLFMVSPLALLALYIGLGSFRVATGAASTLSPWPVPVVVSVILAAVVVATVRTKRSIEALSVA